MTMQEIKQEIARVQVALANTQSEHLKRDYAKYLKRLQKAQKILRRKYK